jgi:hypothetical protein
VVADAARVVRAPVLGVVVDGLLDRAALEQLAQVPAQEVGVERVRVVEVARLAVAERDLLQVLVVAVLVDDDDAPRPSSRRMVRATRVFPEPEPPARPIRMRRDMVASG